MARFRDVKVDSRGREVGCDPMTANVYYAAEKEPDSVRWRFGSVPEGASRVEIRWDGGSPFGSMGLELDDERPVLVGTGNFGVDGVYKYTILFFDGDQVIAGLDPKIVNGPEPPGGG